MKRDSDVFLNKEIIKEIIRGIEEIRILPFEIKVERFKEFWRNFIEQVGTEAFIQMMIELFCSSEEQFDALLESTKSFYEKLLVQIELKEPK